LEKKQWSLGQGWVKPEGLCGGGSVAHRMKQVILLILVAAYNAGIFEQKKAKRQTKAERLTSKARE
jgi:hypothetical protein